jgi:hypothetical protein
MKSSMDPKVLCKDLPIEFCKFLEYARKLSFKSHPDYVFVRKLFRRALKQVTVSGNDVPFDWSESYKRKRRDKKNLSVDQ